jgi:hypothetical protein
MDFGYIGSVCAKLQSRVARLLAIDSPPLIHASTAHLWDFLKREPICVAIIQDLRSRYPNAASEAASLIHQTLETGDELHHLAFASYVLESCAKGDRGSELRVAKSYLCDPVPKDYAGFLQPFKELFVAPLCGYLAEELTEQGGRLFTLQRYRQKCEWFQRVELLESCKANTRHAENTLREHLFQYLHDQGLVLFREPSSVSGNVDLISAQESTNPFAADTKVFDGKSRNKQYVIDGFNQLHTYIAEHHQPFGYLVIYKTCPKHLEFAVGIHSHSTPSVNRGGRTIFLVTVDICDYSKPASKRGPMQTIQITEAELVG